MSIEKRMTAVLFAVAMIVVFISAERMVITGDETRYLLYSFSIFKHGSLQLTESEWTDLYTKAAGFSRPYPWIGDHEIGHPIYLSTLLSPVSYFFSIQGLRAVSFMTGIVGLVSLYKLSSKLTSIQFRPAAAAVFIAATTVPLMPYLRLFYMEVFVFAFLSVGWLRLHRKGVDLRGDVITAAIILAVPFIHLRGSVVAAVMFGIFMLYLWRRGSTKRAMALSAFAVAAAGLLVVLNLVIYGVITGSVNSARPPAPFEAFNVIAMQWFNVRHGLIAFAPIWLFGYAGLVAGALKRERLATEGLILAIVALFTSIGPVPGECWPARFWVTSIPMLTIGLAFWLCHIKNIWQTLATIAFGALTYANTVMFVINPNMLIENRQGSGTYEALFRYTGLNFGMFLPIELPNILNADAARNLMIGALVFTAVAVLSLFRKHVAWLLAVMILSVIDLARARVLNDTAYQITKSTGQIVITMTKPAGPVSLRLGPVWQTWFEPPVTGMTVDVVNPLATRLSWQQPANPMITASCREGITHIVIGVNGEVFSQIEKPVIFQRKSVLQRLAVGLNPVCGP